jgi:hypothetical protein
MSWLRRGGAKSVAADSMDYPMFGAELKSHGARRGDAQAGITTINRRRCGRTTG